MKTKKLVTSAMMISLGMIIALICEYVPFFNPPFGGTITIGSTIPIMIIAYLYGLKWGFLSGFVFGILKMAVGMKTVSALFLPESDSYMGVLFASIIVLLDYILAYTVIGIGGIFRNKLKKTSALAASAALGLFLRYIIHTVSGAIFYGAWAEWFFTDTVIADTAFAGYIISHFSGASLAALYSAVYNGCYMIPEIIISVICIIPLSRAIPEKK